MVIFKYYLANTFSNQDEIKFSSKSIELYTIKDHIIISFYLWRVLHTKTTNTLYLIKKL